MLVVELTYKKTLEEVAKYLQAHRGFLTACYKSGKFLASGPQNPRTGGIVIALVNQDEMKSLIEQDPFYQNGIAEYTIKEFDPVLRCQELESLLA